MVTCLLAVICSCPLSHKRCMAYCTPQRVVDGFSREGTPASSLCTLSFLPLFLALSGALPLQRAFCLNVLLLQRSCAHCRVRSALHMWHYAPSCILCTCLITRFSSPVCQSIIPEWNPMKPSKAFCKRTLTTLCASNSSKEGSESRSVELFSFDEFSEVQNLVWFGCFRNISKYMPSTSQKGQDCELQNRTNLTKSAPVPRWRNQHEFWLVPNSNGPVSNVLCFS